MNHAVRCPRCSSLSRVETDDLGGIVACPICAEPFEAEDVAAPTPPIVLRPSRRRRQPAAPVPTSAPNPQYHLLEETDGPTPILIGLSMLPGLIPLVWFVGPMLFGKEPLFTIAAPTALAVGLTGLCLGVSFSAGWSHTTRVKGVLAIFLLGCFCGGFLYFLKKEWLEDVRKSVRRSPAEWQLFDPPGREYEVEMPVPVEPATNPIPNWPLSAFAFTEPHSAAPDVFIVAHCVPPQDDDDPKDWYAAVKDAAASVGEVLAEREVRVPGHEDETGREYEIGLRDGVTNRIIRAYHVGGRVYYLAAEGPFWRPDTPDVRQFFDSFRVVD